MSYVDIDRPSTWREFRKSLCDTCWAGCCVMPVEVKLEDLVNLGLVSEDEAQGSIKKIAKRLQKEGIIQSVRLGTGLFMLQQKRNRDCRFLDQNRRCTVYEKRPGVCRKFPEEMGTRIGFCPYINKDKIKIQY